MARGARIGGARSRVDRKHHRVSGLDNYQELIARLEQPNGAIKIVGEVGD